MTQFQLGSISTGTLRTEDLIPAFRAALEATGNQGTLALHETPVDERDELATLEIALQEACPPFVYFGAHPGGCDDCAGSGILTAYAYKCMTGEVTDSSHACPTCKGDGADFGFWPDRDAIQEAIDPTSCLVRINANGDCVLEEDGVIVQVSDHGNVTVMDLERNVLWSVV